MPESSFPTPESELFWWACYSNNLLVLPQLLKASPPLNLSIPHPVTGVSPLSIAISRRSDDVLDLLLMTERDRMRSSACSQGSTLTGSPPLGTAVLSGNMLAARLLLQRYGRDALGAVPYEPRLHGGGAQPRETSSSPARRGRERGAQEGGGCILPASDVNGIDCVTLGRSLGPSSRAVSEYIYTWLLENYPAGIPPFLLPHDSQMPLAPEDLTYNCATCGKLNDGDAPKCCVCGRPRVRNSNDDTTSDGKGVLPPLLPEIAQQRPSSKKEKKRTQFEGGEKKGGVGVKFM